MDESLSLAGIGTFCHEFSHVLGLPDFYSTSYTDSFTCGKWSLMDYGPYCNDGHTPPLYGAFERYSLKWLEPEILGEDPLTVCLPSIDSNKAYMLPASRDGEYFIFENRQQTGWDTYIPGHGMLVWHIDFYQGIWNNNSVNNNASHLYVDILEADNTQDEKSRNGDCFPGVAGITSIDDDTAPGLISWENVRSGKSLADIREIDGNIYFEYCGGNPPLGPVAGYAVADVDADRATISWQPLDDAEGYEVYLSSVAGDEEIPVSGFNGRDTGAETHCEVTGLDYSTAYKGYVIAYNRYYRTLAGEGFTFTTSDPKFTQLKPASPVMHAATSDALSLTCPEMENAVAYEFSIFERTYSEGSSDIVDFSDETWQERGWNSTSTDLYKTTSYSGEGAPSLKLTAQGDAITSPEFDSDINEFAFWHRATSNAEGNKISLSICDKNRKEVAVIDVSTSRVSGGHKFILSENVEGPVENLHARSVKITAMPESGSVGDRLYGRSDHVYRRIGDQSSRRDRIHPGHDNSRSDQERRRHLRLPSQ